MPVCLVVDHPADLSVLIDKSGKIQTFRKPSVPVTAENSAGRDITYLYREEGFINFSGNPPDIGKDGEEIIVMKFLKPHNCKSGKLLIRAKNSFWLDVLFTKFHCFLEKSTIHLQKSRNRHHPVSLTSFFLIRKSPYQFILKKNGKWQSAGYFNIAGPMAMRDDILPVDLTGIQFRYS